MGRKRKNRWNNFCLKMPEWDQCHFNTPLCQQQLPCSVPTRSCSWKLLRSQSNPYSRHHRMARLRGTLALLRDSTACLPCFTGKVSCWDLLFPHHGLQVLIKTPAKSCQHATVTLITCSWTDWVLEERCPITSGRDLSIKADLQDSPSGNC